MNGAQNCSFANLELLCIQLKAYNAKAKALLKVKRKVEAMVPRKEMFALLFDSLLWRKTHTT